MTAVHMSTRANAHSERRGDFLVLALIAVLIPFGAHHARTAVVEGDKREGERRFALTDAQNQAVISGFGGQFTGVHYADEAMHATWLGDNGVSCNLLVVPAPEGEPRGYRVAWETERSVPQARNDPSILGCYETSG